MCEEFVKEQVDRLEKGIEVGVKEFFRQKKIEGKVPPDVLAKVMAQLYMGIVCSSVAAGKDADVEEGEKLIDSLVDFFLK